MNFIIGLALLINCHSVFSNSNWKSTDQFHFEYHFDGSRERTLQDARDYCRSLNSSLPKFSTKVEQDWVEVHSASNNQFWLDAATVYNSKAYSKWSDGVAFQYTDWAWHEPNSYFGCGAIIVAYVHWYDSDCNSTSFPVCQRSKLRAHLAEHVTKGDDGQGFRAQQELRDHIERSKNSTEKMRQEMVELHEKANATLAVQLAEQFSVLIAREESVLKNISIVTSLNSNINASLEEFKNAVNHRLELVEQGMVDMGDKLSKLYGDLNLSREMFKNAISEQLVASTPAAVLPDTDKKFSNLLIVVIVQHVFSVAIVFVIMVLYKRLNQRMQVADAKMRNNFDMKRFS